MGVLTGQAVLPAGNVGEAKQIRMHCPLTLSAQALCVRRSLHTFHQGTQHNPTIFTPMRGNRALTLLDILKVTGRLDPLDPLGSPLLGEDVSPHAVLQGQEGGTCP